MFEWLILNSGIIQQGRGFFNRGGRPLSYIGGVRPGAALFLLKIHAKSEDYGRNHHF